jgi:mRNA-degrading endonuclease RelE of RelBE toxin-antitoxin system
MNVLIAPQFNSAMQNLSKQAQQEVSKLYSFVTKADKEIIISSAFTKITSKNNDIFTLRGRTVRIFCTFSQQNENEVLVLLDVSTVHDIGFNPSAELKGEITLFNSRGEPIAYIADKDENTIFSFNGEPLAYLAEGNSIYGFNGKHLGWFEDQIVWDHLGQRVGFTKKTCPTLTQFEPFKGFKQYKPFKTFKQLVPLKPLKSSIVSSIELLKFLKDGSS